MQDIRAMCDSLMSLSRDEKLYLLQALWQDLSKDLEVSELSDEEIATLDRRLAEIDAHPERLIPWEDALARLEAKFPV